MTNLPSVMYWDYFAKRYCLEKDPYAPPERYVKTYSRCDHYFVETYSVAMADDSSYEGKKLSISFAEELYVNYPELADSTRQRHFKKNECVPIAMIRFEVPEQFFKEQFENVLKDES